jgi:hypothetical protein
MRITETLRVKGYLCWLFCHLLANVVYERRSPNLPHQALVTQQSATVQQGQEAIAMKGVVSSLDPQRLAEARSLIRRFYRA